MKEAIKRLRNMLTWSDRIGSDEIVEIVEIINLLKEENELNRNGSTSSPADSRT